MFADSGEITAPWGVPLSAATLHPTSITPGLSHLRIGPSIPQSGIQRSRIVITVVVGFFPVRWRSASAATVYPNVYPTGFGRKNGLAHC
jgi:hypothetical protein